MLNGSQSTAFLGNTCLLSACTFSPMWRCFVSQSLTGLTEFAEPADKDPQGHQVRDLHMVPLPGHNRQRSDGPPSMSTVTMSSRIIFIVTVAPWVAPVPRPWVWTRGGPMMTDWLTLMLCGLRTRSTGQAQCARQHQWHAKEKRKWPHGRHSCENDFTNCSATVPLVVDSSDPIGWSSFIPPLCLLLPGQVSSHMSTSLSGLSMVPPCVRSSLPGMQLFTAGEAQPMMMLASPVSSYVSPGRASLATLLIGRFGTLHPFFIVCDFFIHSHTLNLVCYTFLIHTLTNSDALYCFTLFWCLYDWISFLSLLLLLLIPKLVTCHLFRGL